MQPVSNCWRAVQVVGRVQSGQEAIAAVLVLGTNAHDGPRQPVTITASGLTNAKGACLHPIVTIILDILVSRRVKQEAQCATFD